MKNAKIRSSRYPFAQEDLRGDEQRASGDPNRDPGRGNSEEKEEGEKSPRLTPLPSLSLSLVIGSHQPLTTHKVTSYTNSHPFL